MLQILGVSKRFGKTVALDNVSFDVRNGEVVGYVGLNGAGKTTTIRIAVGILPPDRGDVVVDGVSIVKDKRRASKGVGWVPELPIFETDFRAIDYFVYLAGYYGLSSGEARRLGRELLEMVGLGNALSKKLAEYSLGMKKRFALAVSMINDPPNFLFDEVLNGLDPQGIAFFRELTIDFRKRGKAVLFSSHILSEVEGIADRVVFIHRGKIVGVYTIDEIKHRASPAIELVLSRVVDSDVLAILSRYGEPRILDANKVVLRSPTADTSSLLSELVSKGVKVEEAKKVEKSLEEFFFNLIKEVESKR